jgi:hypothetical protein
MNKKKKNIEGWNERRYIYYCTKKKNIYLSKGLPARPSSNARCRKGEHWKLKKGRRWAKINLSYISTLSTYRAVNTFRLSYTNQSVNAV